MFTQQNVLRVFVSDRATPVYDDAGGTPAPISFSTFCTGSTYHGAIAAFAVSTNLSVDIAETADAYIAFNDGGKIKTSEVIPGFTWDIISYAAETPMSQDLTITGTIVADEVYQLEIRTLTDNYNGDETKKANYMVKSGDTASIVADALIAGIQASLKNDVIKDYTIAKTSTATIHVVALQQPFKLGRKPGGFTKFNMILSKPVYLATNGVTTIGTVGIGVGRVVLTQEFFARQNSDAVSINQFRTALPIKLNAVESGIYDVQEVVHYDKIWDNDGGAIQVQKNTLVAFLQ